MRPYFDYIVQRVRAFAMESEKPIFEIVDMMTAALKLNAVERAELINRLFDCDDYSRG